MQLDDSRLRLVKMDFLTLHHIPYGFGSEDSAFYDLQISETAPDDYHETHGDRLRLEFPSDPVVFPEHETVLLQILNTYKLWVKYDNRQHDPVARHLHKIKAIVWGVSEKDQIVAVGDKVGLRIEKLDEISLSVVLDKEFVVHSEHCYQNNHLAAVLSMQHYQTLKEQSAYLSERTETMLELFDVELWLGQTKQEALDSQDAIFKSRGVSHRAFYLVEYAQVSVTCLEPTLFNSLFNRRASMVTYPRVVDFVQHVDRTGLLPYLTKR